MSQSGLETKVSKNPLNFKFSKFWKMETTGTIIVYALTICLSVVYSRKTPKGNNVNNVPITYIYVK